MTEYAELAKKAEEAVKGVADEGLRRIAFDQILKQELSRLRETEDHREPHAGARQQGQRRRKPRGRNTQTSEPSGTREQVKNLALSTDEPGLPRWSALGQIDKYLWVLEAGHKKGIEGLTAAEIRHLIFATFRESHKANQVNNLATRLKQGHVRKVRLPEGSHAWQILKGGKDHLKEVEAQASLKR